MRLYRFLIIQEGIFLYVRQNYRSEGKRLHQEWKGVLPMVGGRIVKVGVECENKWSRERGVDCSKGLK